MRVTRVFSKRAVAGLVGGLALFGGMAAMAPSAMAADEGGSAATKQERATAGFAVKGERVQIPAGEGAPDEELKCETVEKHDDYVVIKCEGSDGGTVITVPAGGFDLDDPIRTEKPTD